MNTGRQRDKAAAGGVLRITHSPADGTAVTGTRHDDPPAVREVLHAHQCEWSPRTGARGAWVRPGSPAADVGALAEALRATGRTVSVEIADTTPGAAAEARTDQRARAARSSSVGRRAADRGSPRVVHRRIEHVEELLRRCDQAFAATGSDDKRALLVDKRAERTAELSRLRERLDAFIAAGDYRPWTCDHFKPGDIARVGYGEWRKVVAVGPKDLTVKGRALAGPVWNDTMAYHQVYGRRRDGDEIDQPPVDDEA